MAEIKIEKKKPIWPWILLVLIILLAAFLYFMYGDQIDDDNDMDDVETEMNDDYDDNEYDENEGAEDTISYEDSLNMENSNRAVQAYTMSVQDTTRLGSDQVSTKSALMNLTRAVEAKAMQFNMNNSETLMMLKEDVRKADSTMSATNQGIDTKLFKSVGMNVMAVMDTIQKVQFPDLMNDVSDVQTALNKISPQQTLAKQTQAVNSFFRESNEVLNGMNTNFKTNNYEQ